MLDMKIKVKVSELIDSLRENKKAHVEDFKKAKSVYFDDLEEALDKLTVDAVQGTIRDDNYMIMFRPPILNEANYDKYINMLHMSQDNIIEIGTDEYERFVEDTWDWAVSARMLNSTYSSKFS